MKHSEGKEQSSNPKFRPAQRKKEKEADVMGAKALQRKSGTREKQNR